MTRYRGAVRFFLSSRINAVTAVMLGILYLILFYSSVALYATGSTGGNALPPEFQKLVSVAIVSIMYLALEVPQSILFIKSDADFLFSFSLPKRVMAKCAAVYGSMISIILVAVFGIFIRIISTSRIPDYATLLFILAIFITSVFTTLSFMFIEKKYAWAGTAASILLTFSYLTGNPVSPASITGNQWQFGLISVFALLVMWIYIAWKSLKANSTGMLYFRGRDRVQEVRKPLDFNNIKGINAFRHLISTIGILSSAKGRIYRFRYRNIFIINVAVMAAFSIFYVFSPPSFIGFVSDLVIVPIYLNTFLLSYSNFRLRFERLWISWMPFSRVRGMRAYITSGAFANIKMFIPLIILAAVFIIFPKEYGTFIITRINSYDAFPLIYLVAAIFPASILGIFLSTIITPEPVRDDLLVTPSIATGIVASIPVIYVYISAIVGFFTNEYIFIYSIAVLAILSAIVISSSRIMDFAYRRISSALYT